MEAKLCQGPVARHRKLHDAGALGPVHDFSDVGYVVIRVGIMRSTGVMGVEPLFGLFG